VVDARPRHRLTQAQEDYLKALYHLRGDQRPVATGELAQRLGISAASVSEMMTKLSGQGLVVHDRYHGQQLTAEAHRIAVELVRHHRLLEMFLVEVLGYGWDEVHDEAERLEHVISEKMEERIYELLGRPELDPHGHAIPTREGDVPEVSQRALTEFPAGATVAIQGVSDEDADLLRELQRRGLTPGTKLKVLAASRYESPIETRIGRRRLSVPLGLARAIFVVEVEGDGG
jgi:DtxR family Mn-dependent transcriptional regulator